MNGRWKGEIKWASRFGRGVKNQNRKKTGRESAEEKWQYGWGKTRIGLGWHGEKNELTPGKNKKQRPRWVGDVFCGQGWGTREG